MKRKDRVHAIKREQITKFIGAIVFAVILLKVFCNVTYLFRYVAYDRDHIAGIKNEMPDMVYIGGSAAFTFWQPLKAWHDCGFTSYNYATNAIQAENIKAYVEEVRKTRDPELFVIGVRAFQYYSDDESEGGLRNGTDSMDLTSIARYKLLNDYFSNRTISEETDVLSYYLDIIKYHTNTGNLAYDGAWKRRNNTGVCVNKGWEWIDNYGYLDRPVDFKTNVRGELELNSKKILVDLLEYCKREELQVLFVVCPYWIVPEHQELYNTMSDMVESYGFHFLNANLYYDEMNLDFSEDFYNCDHVNLFGAEKYTEFLENYILEQYDMPDHRGEVEYASWDIEYKRFIEEKAVHTETVTNLRLDVEKGIEIAEEMKQAESLAEWNMLAEDSRFTILITACGNTVWPENAADRKILENWGFSEENIKGVRVISGSSILNDLADESGVTEGTIGKRTDHSYCLSVKAGKSSIVVDKKEWISEKNGFNAVVFDNNYERVTGSIVIDSVEGEMKLVG